MRRKRLAALALVIAAVPTAGLLRLGPLASAAGPPSNAVLPDFPSNANASSTGIPYQEDAPAVWGFYADTGGISTNQQVILHFGFGDGDGPVDHLHAVSFLQLNPAIALNDVTVGSIPGVSGLPGKVHPPNCATPGAEQPNAVAVDPYAQTITIRVPPGLNYGAGSTLMYCISSKLVGFPVSPGPGYKVTYIEPGGETSASYSVSPQATGKSFQMHVLDADRSDITNAGVGGGRIARYTSTYNVSLTGAVATGYHFYEAPFPLDTSTESQVEVNLVGTSSSPVRCNAQQRDILCTDATGNATGQLTVTSSVPSIQSYVVIYGVTTAATQSVSATQEENGQLALTVGPPESTAPSPPPLAPPTQQPVGGGGEGSDPACKDPITGDAGIGTVDFYKATTQALLPALLAECPFMEGQLDFTGANDAIAIAKVFDGSPVYAFGGLDRNLTHSEWTTEQSAPGALGVEQFPVDIQPLVIAYNLPTDVPACDVSQLNLRSAVLSAIFAGVVTRWNDKTIVADNGGLSGCNLPILVAHDTGQATAVLQDYLSKRNPQWTGYAQSAVPGTWPPTAPSSCTANGSAAMALCVEGRSGTIGYGFYHDIHAAGLKYASVDNSAHVFWDNNPADPGETSPLTGCTNAASNDPAVTAQTSNGDWSAVSMADWSVGYPICSFNFVVTATRVCRGQVYYDRGLLAFMGATMSPFGQQKLQDNGYAQLPSNVITNNGTGLKQLQGCQDRWQ